MPLGDTWSGFCVALSRGSFAPPEAVQRELCNCGYARGRCAYFPLDSEADAVRFAPNGSAIEGEQALVYILEKDHAPLAYGEFREVEHNPAMVAQARAFRDGLRNGDEVQRR